jgi:cytochrome c biogenesis protein CcdA
MFTRIFNIAVGVFSVGLGCLALYDFLIFQKTKETGGMVLQLPASVKNQIHAVIGMHYRLQPRHDSGHPAPRPLLRLVGSALVSGFLVSLLEAVCTGQVYLPTITFVLKTSPHKVQALEYLVLYNLMFCLPLVIIFCLALFGATSAQFAHFLKKHLGTVKIAIACLFFGLGIFLIWKG